MQVDTKPGQPPSVELHAPQEEQARNHFASRSSFATPSRDALQTSEIRYRRLFESARDGILILDAITCRITDSNPFMSELLGYAREELIGKELWEIGLLKDEQASREAFRI